MITRQSCSKLTKIPAKIVEIMATISKKLPQTTWMLTDLQSNPVTMKKQTGAYFGMLFMLQKVNLNSCWLLDWTQMLFYSCCFWTLWHFFNYDLQELWNKTGTRKNWRWLPIHLYGKILHQEMCQALCYWFALTERDSVSTFAGWEKKTAWSFGKSIQKQHNFSKGEISFPNL